MLKGLTPTRWSLIYRTRADHGPSQAVHKFHCGEHLGEHREACDIFVFSAFEDERIVLEAAVGGVLSTYTYTKQTGRMPRLR